MRVNLHVKVRANDNVSRISEDDKLEPVVSYVAVCLLHAAPYVVVVCWSRAIRELAGGYFPSMIRYSGCQLNSSIVTEGTTTRVYWKDMLAVLGQNDRNPNEKDNKQRPTSTQGNRQSWKRSMSREH